MSVDTSGDGKPWITVAQGVLWVVSWLLVAAGMVAIARRW